MNFSVWLARVEAWAKQHDDEWILHLIEGLARTRRGEYYNALLWNLINKAPELLPNPKDVDEWVWTGEITPPEDPNGTYEF